MKFILNFRNKTQAQVQALLADIGFPVIMGGGQKDSDVKVFIETTQASFEEFLEAAESIEEAFDITYEPEPTESGSQEPTESGSQEPTESGSQDDGDEGTDYNNDGRVDQWEKYGIPADDGWYGVFDSMWDSQINGSYGGAADGYYEWGSVENGDEQWSGPVGDDEDLMIQYEFSTVWPDADEPWDGFLGVIGVGEQYRDADRHFVVWCTETTDSRYTSLTSQELYKATRTMITVPEGCEGLIVTKDNLAAGFLTGTWGVYYVPEQYIHNDLIFEFTPEVTFTIS